MSKHRILFLTVGDRKWASSRFRSYWPSDMVDGWDAIQFKTDGSENNIPTNYDLYVWMKVGDTKAMKQLRDMGKLNVVEVCDPNWWYQPEIVRELIDVSSFIVSATQPALDDLMRWYGTEKRSYIVPDRMNMAHYKKQRTHHHAKPVRIIWYGVGANRVSIVGAVPVMERLKASGVDFEFTICDNDPGAQFEVGAFPTYHVKWSLDNELDIISAHDIALLPPYPGPWGQIKSNNKKLTAWACGLPVTDGYDFYEFYDLCTRADIREREALKGWNLLHEKYLTEHTVKQWEEIIEKELAFV